MKHIGSGNLLYGARCSNQVLRDNLEGWGGVGDAEGFERGELYVYLWLIHVDVWQKPRQHCKATIPQLKIICFYKRNVWGRKKIIKNKKHTHKINS